MPHTLTILQSCLAAEIGQSTLANWKNRHSELVEQMAEAREQVPGKRHWPRSRRPGNPTGMRSKFSWKVSYPEYRQPNTEVEVNTNGQAGEVKVVCTEGQRQAMTKARD
jgi:hypothetical protein